MQQSGEEKEERKRKTNLFHCLLSGFVLFGALRVLSRLVFPCFYYYELLAVSVCHLALRGGTEEEEEEEEAEAAAAAEGGTDDESSGCVAAAAAAAVAFAVFEFVCVCA